jgi:HAD superfamily hydrolase (TIGR01549 family)
MAIPINALTFDWYGTLANHRRKGRGTLFSEYLASRGLEAAPWDRSVLYEVFDYYSRVYQPQSSDEEKRIFSVEFTNLLFERSQVRGIGSKSVHIYADEIAAIFGASCFQLYPDVQPVLHRLRRDGLRIAVISNWHRGLEYFCREMNLSDLIDTVISSADVGIEKPDSRIFTEAAHQLGVEPDRIVHIGDQPHDDFNGAISAGFKAVLMDRSNNHPTHPNRITSLFELQRQLSLLE